MRQRARHEQRDDRSRGEPSQKRERERREERESDREKSAARVRVPKIQYRFLKDLEQRGPREDAVRGAQAMADKIREYPLDAKRVMASWERFTGRAISEYKDGRGDPVARDRQHEAYAVLFSALRDREPVKDVGELRERLASGAGAQRVEPGQQERQAPEQQSLLERERPLIERQVDRTLDHLRQLSPQLRSTIETSARELLVEGHHTQESAHEALPDAINGLRGDHGEKNTVHTLTLAVIARTPSQAELLSEANALPFAHQKEIKDEARARLERYPPLETGVADVQRDSVAASVRNAVAPSAATRREALVLAEAREEIESLADPTRTSFQHVGEDLARDLA